MDQSTSSDVWYVYKAIALQDLIMAREQIETFRHQIRWVRWIVRWKLHRVRESLLWDWSKHRCHTSWNLLYISKACDLQNPIETKERKEVWRRQIRRLRWMCDNSYMALELEVAYMDRSTWASMDFFTVWVRYKRISCSRHLFRTQGTETACVFCSVFSIY